MRKILLAMAIIVLSSAPALAQNVLGNPGFETPFQTPTTPVNDWATFRSALGEASQSTVEPHSGIRHVLLLTDGQNEFAGVYQNIDVPVLPGYVVTYSGWHKAGLNPIGSNNEIKFEWTGAPQEVINQNPSSDYSQFSLTKIAPPGVTDLRVTYAIATFGAGLGTSVVFIDDMSLTVAVPEPATAGLLIMGMLGMMRFRRK